MDRPSQARRWLPVLAVCALLAVAWLAASTSALDIAELPAPERTSFPRSADASQISTPGQAPPGTPQPGFTLPGWLTTIAVVLCVAATAALAGGLVILLLRSWAARERPLVVEQSRPDPLAPRTAEEHEVVAAVEAGLEALADPGTDPRRAVIACWVRLEQAAAAAGTPRRPSDAPADHVLRLLAEHRVSRRVLDRFAAVYRHARYSSGPVDESDRATAVDALRRLRDELTAAADATGADATGTALTREVAP
jgi:Domain of unknown function (DUF4129)